MNKMGCAASKVMPGPWKDDKEADASLLLLGSGSSGKSTLVKQMRIINMNGFKDEERKSYLTIMHDNIATCMLSATTLMSENDMRFPEVATTNLGWEYFIKLMTSHNTLSSMTTIDRQEVFQFLQTAYKEPSVKECLTANRDALPFAEVGLHFMDKIKEVTTPGYLPNDEDILRCRLPTTGVHEIEFLYKDSMFKMIDVGGQRSERRKWIHFFDNVTAVIFCVSINEYNMALDEDQSENAMTESMNIFQSIINSVFFRDKQIILFLNKMDLFQEKIKLYPLNIYFNDFVGNPSSQKDSVAYIQRKYLALDKQPNRKIITHPTCATNTKNIETVTSVAFNGILDQLATEVGLM